MKKFHVFKQNYENSEISLLSRWMILSIIKQSLRYSEQKKLIKCNFIHSYKLLTLFSLYFNKILMTEHHEQCNMQSIHKNLSTPVKKENGEEKMNNFG